MIKLIKEVIIMNLLNKSSILVKKSKFIAYYYSLESLDEITKIILEIKKEYKKATHIVYAYNFQGIMKKTDDNEPSGSAGLPILHILMKNNLQSHLIVVVRFYGGIKLGLGVLHRTYLNLAKQVTKKS